MKTEFVEFKCTCGQRNRLPESVISVAADRGPRGAVTASGLGFRCGKCKREFDGADVHRWMVESMGFDPMGAP